MASVTFPPSLGGDGSTVTDDASPTTGLASGGHRTRFVPALAQVVAVAGSVVTNAQAAANSAAAAAASASTAINAPGTSATSATNNTIGTGAKTFTIQTGKAFVVGQPVMIARTSAPSTTWMAGNITAHNSDTGSLTVDVVWTNGSGTFTDWTISLAGPTNPAAVSRAGDTMTGDLTVPNLTVDGTLDYGDTVVVISANTTAVKSRTYVLTASLTLTLPSGPTAGDWVSIINRSGTTTPVIARNGQNIMGLAEDMTLDNLNASLTLVYADATRGWVWN